MKHQQRIVIRLKEAIQVYKVRTGRRLTYQILSDQTGLSLHTIQSMATRRGHVTSIRNIERLCLFLGCAPGDLLAIESHGPSSEG
jgi:DNA-binding Xre family transcriptional regulator